MTNLDPRCRSTPTFIKPLLPDLHGSYRKCLLNPNIVGGNKSGEEDRDDRGGSLESGKSLSESSSGEEWGGEKGKEGRKGRGNGGVMGRINKPSPFKGTKEGWRRYKGLFLNWAKVAGIEKTEVINSLLTFLSSEDFEKVDSLNLTRKERADPVLAFMCTTLKRPN